jgi:hypothetical protein
MWKYKTGLLQVVENQSCEKEDVELQVPTCVHSDVAESTPVRPRSRRCHQQCHGPWRTTPRGQTRATATTECAQSLEGQRAPVAGPDGMDTRGCEATSSTERVCAHGADGRPRWESPTACSAIAMSRRMRTRRCGTASGRAVATLAHGTAPVTASIAARWHGGSPRSPHTHPRERDEEV